MSQRMILLLSFLFLTTFACIHIHAAKARGIYITQPTLEDTTRITQLIRQAKAVNINTFVVDYSRASKAYTKNIQLVKESGIKYVARIVIFPDGASNRSQMLSLGYREKKLALIKQAIALGAQEIQLDYIRYSSKNRPSPQNVQDVKSVVKWYYQHLQAAKVPMQIDVFGITTFHPENRIGQYPQVFADTTDAINPMVYPSHFEPYRMYSAQPYKTVFSSLQSLKEQLKGKPPIKIHAFIEASNYRYPLSRSQKLNYVKAQMKATEDANVDGWYFWSANNIYGHVFQVLRTQAAENNQSSEKGLRYPISKPTLADS